MYLKTTVDDLGNTGEGDNLTNDNTDGNDEIKISVVPVNDLPVISAAPDSLATNEDTLITFNDPSNPDSEPTLSIIDVDYDETPDGVLLVTLAVTNGKLSLNLSADLDNTDLYAFTVGDGADDDTMTFATSEELLQTALEGMTYTPDPDYNETDGTSILTITVSDEGQTGLGELVPVVETISITVDAVNDPPVITLANEITIDEDTTITFTDNVDAEDTTISDLINISDVDTHEHTGNLSIELEVSNGSLTAPNLGIRLLKSLEMVLMIYFYL